MPARTANARVRQAEPGQLCPPRLPRMLLSSRWLGKSHKELTALNTRVHHTHPFQHAMALVWGRSAIRLPCPVP
jgi:hypothetical protein